MKALTSKIDIVEKIISCVLWYRRHCLSESRKPRKI